MWENILILKTWWQLALLLFILLFSVRTRCMMWHANCVHIRCFKPCFSQEAYFAVNGNGHPSPVISPPPAVGQFSPPSIPGTPVRQGTPGWLEQWRAPSGSDHERSPYAARAAHISIPEINHLRIREEEPIKVSTTLNNFRIFRIWFLDN